jgi:hypothetical protein
MKAFGTGLGVIGPTVTRIASSAIQPAPEVAVMPWHHAAICKSAHAALRVESRAGGQKLSSETGRRAAAVPKAVMIRRHQVLGRLCSLSTALSCTLLASTNLS